MAANLKLASARDGNRVELAEAIEGVAKAERAVETASAAEAKAEERIDQAYERLRAARAAAANVEEREVAALVATFSGAAPMEVISLAQAQAAVVEAERALTLANKALGQVRLAAEEPARDVRKAQERVERAIGAVVSGTIPGLLEAAHKAEKTIIDLRLQIRFLISVSHGPDKEPLEAFLRRPWLIHELGDEWKRHEATLPWRKAREALMRDAGAPLPD
jgi:hypothetical protein